jgi:hypothetical protein
MKKNILLLFLQGISIFIFAQSSQKQYIDKKTNEIESKVIDWRRHLHQNPELSNREFQTGKYIAAHLKTLGIEVRENVAKTGCVGIIKGENLVLLLHFVPILMLYL